MGQKPEDADKTAASFEARASDRSVPGLIRPSLIEFIAGVVDEVQLYSCFVDYGSRYILAAEEVIFLLAENNLKILTVKATKGARSGLLRDRSFNLAGSEIVSIFEDRTVINIPDTIVETESGRADEMTNELQHIGVRSLIFSAVGNFGVLAAAARRPQAFSKYDEVTLKSAAKQAAYVLNNSIRLKELEKSLAETRRLLELTERLAMTSTFSSLLRSTLQAVREVVKGDTGSLMLLDETTQELKIKAAFGLPDKVGLYSVKLGQGIAGWVAKHKKAVVVKDLPAKQELIAGGKLISAISVPMLAGDHLVGVVNIGSKKTEVVHSQEEVDLATRLLTQAAVAIDNFRLGGGREELYLDTVKALVRIIETRDPYLTGHAEKVTKITLAIAKKLLLSDEEIKMIETAALLHDVGYVNVNASIFRLTQPLSTVERALIKTHPAVANEVIRQIPRLAGAADIILSHHENFDGSGYTRGLRGDGIPLGSRILAVADAYEAMISKRAYREALSIKQALAELRQCAGSQFDPQVVDTLLQLFKEDPALADDHH